MTDSIFKLTPKRIAELREVADSVNVAELTALVALWSLRDVQRIREDQIMNGELYPDEYDFKREDVEQQALQHATEDILIYEDIEECAKVNDLGDYSITTKLTIAKKSV